MVKAVTPSACSLPFFILLLGTHSLNAAETGQGAQLAAICAACHPADGPGAGIPAIAGRDEAAIIDAMRRFGADGNPSHVMHAVALSLSDDELAAVAHYIAAQAGGGRR